MPTKYYQVDASRLTLAEYWRMSPNALTFLFAAAMRAIGAMSFDFSIPRPDELRVVDLDDLPDSALKCLRPALNDFRTAGLELALCHEADVLEDHRYGAGLAFLARDGRSFGAVNYGEENDIRRVEISLVSPFDDDTFGVTTTAKKQFKPHPAYLNVRFPEMTAGELCAAHDRNLDRWESDGKRPRRITRESLPGLILEAEQRFVDFHVERGVFVPMSKAEVRLLRGEREQR
jgi:hypothetical protein